MSRSISRKELFHNLLGGFREVGRRAAALPSARPERLVRPPGARLPDTDYLAACTGCEACVPACPPGAIFMASVGDETPRRVAVLDAERKPCFMCRDLPCIAACTPRALQPLAGPRTMRIGIAQISPLRCRTFREERCDLCIKVCPLPGEAIRAVNGRPIVAAQHCTGCGLCVMACPESPKAVQVFPERDLLPGVRLPIVPLR